MDAGLPSVLGLLSLILSVAKLNWFLSPLPFFLQSLILPALGGLGHLAPTKSLLSWPQQLLAGF